MPEELTWRKSSYSKGTDVDEQCVELAALPGGGVAVRNSKLGDASPVVEYTTSEIKAFLLGAKAGEFDDLAV